MTKRDWAAMREKCDAERGCRICLRHPVEAAHIIPRSRVNAGPAEDPRNCCPLCRAHHDAYDRGTLDLLPVLTREEQAYVVWLVGLEEARRYVTNTRSVAQDFYCSPCGRYEPCEQCRGARPGVAA